MGEASEPTGSRTRERLLALSWVGLLLAGALLRTLDSGVGRELGSMCLGVSGLAFAALAFLLLDERPHENPTAFDCAAPTARRRVAVRRAPTTRRAGDPRASASAYARERRGGDRTPVTHTQDRAGTRRTGHRAASRRSQPHLRRRPGGRGRPTTSS